MKLSHRLALIVSCAVIGLVLIAGFALSTLRSTMLEDKRNEGTSQKTENKAR